MFSDVDLAPVMELLRSGKLCGYWQSFSGGPYLQEFEERFADYIGTGYAVAVSNGTVSIYLALLACGIGKGDKIAVSPYTHLGSVAPIVWAGAEPVFIDVDKFGNIDPTELHRYLERNYTDIEEASEHVKAVIAVHHLGQPCDMNLIDRVIPNAFIIEDASQALGAEYKGFKAGSIGDVGCFSIGGDMTKAISTGEGGIITIHDPRIAEKCRNLRNHGETREARYLCFNQRLSEIQALIGLLQMIDLKFEVSWQINNAEYLVSQLPSYLKVNKSPEHVKPVHYIVNCSFHGSSRRKFLEAVTDKGVKGGIPRRNIGLGYQKLIYEIPFYKQFARRCPKAEKMRDEAIWIDWHRPPRTRMEIDELITVLKEIEDEGRF